MQHHHPAARQALYEAQQDAPCSATALRQMHRSAAGVQNQHQAAEQQAAQHVHCSAADVQHNLQAAGPAALPHMHHNDAEKHNHNWVAEQPAPQHGRPSAPDKPQQQATDQASQPMQGSAADRAGELLHKIVDRATGGHDEGITGNTRLSLYTNIHI